MADVDPDWTLYRSALAVLREGSLSGAARALGLTQPTIGRHIQALESSLGATLFMRSLHGLAPTESLSQILPHLEALEASASAVRRSLSQQANRNVGTVRITASDIVGAEVLPPIIRSLQQEHPGLVIELVLSNKIEDLLRRDADIAVRMVRPTQAPLLTQLIGKTRLGLYAHRDYLKEHGTPTSLQDLRQHRVIGFDHETAFTRQIRDTGVPLRRDLFSLRCDSDLAQLAALRARCGIGVCQAAIAARTPALLPVLPNIKYHLDIWLAMHGDLRSNHPCRLTFDALSAGLKLYLRAPNPKRDAVST
jgi:DNA-binding transcriptional LysR family regulator